MNFPNVISRLAFLFAFIGILAIAPLCSVHADQVGCTQTTSFYDHSDQASFEENQDNAAVEDSLLDLTTELSSHPGARTTSSQVQRTHILLSRYTLELISSPNRPPTIG